jgi:ADP-ribose pyrophosphatase YjhB (NUDIX family)
MQPSDRFHLIGAIFIILIKDNQVFLSRRKNTGWEDGKYSLVGGHLDGNEPATFAAVREAKEEMGVIIDPKDVRFANVSHLITNTERIHFTFVAQKWEGEPKNNEPERADAAGWFPLDKLPENITAISRQTLEWVKEKVVYTEWGWDKQYSY